MAEFSASVGRKEREDRFAEASAESPVSTDVPRLVAKGSASSAGERAQPADDGITTVATTTTTASDAAELDLHAELDSLRAELAQTQLKLQDAQGKIEEWQALVEDGIFSALFLPEHNERYRSYAAGLVTAGLLEIPQVTRIKYVRCSFPSLRREAPKLKLGKYTSLSSSEWDLSWAPSWSLDVCVEGYHYLYFTILTRVSKVSVKGRVQAQFGHPLGIGGIRLGFVRKPTLSMELESTVDLGLAPMPVQDQIADIVRALCSDWLLQNLVEPNMMDFKPSSGPPPPPTLRARSAGEADGADLSNAKPVDDEVERAVLAALTHRLTEST